MMISADPLAAGGVQNHVFYLAKEFEKLGHQVEIFGPVATNQKLYQNYQSWCQRLAMPAPNGGWGEITFNTAETDEMIEQLNSGEFDICHIHSPYLPFANWTLLTKLKIPIIITFHTAWQTNSSLGWFEPLFQPLAGVMSDHVKAAIFVSKQAQKNWQLTCNPKIIQKVIVNGVSSDFKPVLKSQEPGSKVKLLFLARLVTSKGLGFLLEALALLDKKLKWELTVVGTGKAEADFINQAKRLKLTPKVKFVGEIMGTKAIQFFQQSQVFCAPYFDEGGTSLSIVEAMACGLPIVGFENPAFKDVLRQYPQPKFFVPVKDVIELAKVLTLVIRESKVRKLTGDWCAKRAKKFYWLYPAQETLKLYQTVLAN